MGKLITPEGKEIVNRDEEIKQMRLLAQNFQKRLHQEPKKEEVKVNKHAGNSKYLPISFLEMSLDELFFGAWQTKEFKYQVIANEIAGSLELTYFHPVYNIWLTRVGAGAVQIQFKKDSDITELHNKIKNTLTKDFPHLKAECFRNACLSIGKSFGRDLNREYWDSYNPIIKEEQSEQTRELIDKIMILLDEYVGDDKSTLKQSCASAIAKGKFDKKFAESIAKKIGVKL